MHRFQHVQYTIGLLCISYLAKCYSISLLHTFTNANHTPCCYVLYAGLTEIEETLDTAASISQPPLTQHHKVREKTMSHNVSQLQPAIPVLTKYKQYLQSVYNARLIVIAPADKYLPTLGVPYINLAMIKTNRSYDPQERDEFTNKTLHGGVDEILKSKTPIQIEDLLCPDSDCEPVRFVLVEGPPGIGKSTFAWEVCRRWDSTAGLRDYHTVVLLRLREKWVLNATSLSDLFRYPFRPRFSRSIAQKLHNLEGQNLLLVLDGFDEISHKFHEKSVIKSILCKELLPKCTIILTTRPSAKHILKCVCDPEIDKHVEVIGFTEEERVRYITEVFRMEPQLQANFLKYMFLVPHIKSMMYIPLNCAIIAQVYYESQKSSHLAMPKTRTQLYRALTHSLLVRHMTKNRLITKCSSILPDNLDKKHMEEFKILAKFAFESYHMDESRKVTFLKEEIPEGMAHFGFMNESKEMYASRGVEQTFSFMHLSLQEYLAAWHLANSYSDEFLVKYHTLAIGLSSKDIEEESVTSRSSCSMSDEMEEETESKDEEDMPTNTSESNEADIFEMLEPLDELLVEPAIFLAGITGWKCRSGDGKKNYWKNYIRRGTELAYNIKPLLISLYEAQNPILISHYFDAEEIDYQLQAGDLCYHAPGIHLEIGSTLTHKTPYECYALSYCLAHSDQNFDLDLVVMNDNDVSLLEMFVKGLNDHCKSLPPQVWYLNVELNYASSEISNRCVFWLMKAPFLPHLEDITIESSTVVSALSPFLIQITKLQTNQLAKLELHRITRENMAGVRVALLHCPNLSELVLTRTSLSYDGILYICSTLRRNTSLNHLVIEDDIENPPIRQRMAWSCIDYSLFATVRTAPLPDKTTITELLLSMNDILKHNSTVETVDIKSGLFLPLSPDHHRRAQQWTGLGPLQQFNLGAISRGMPPNLRRSFSSSDLTQPKTIPFWKREFVVSKGKKQGHIDFKRLFLAKKKKKGKKLRSFTAPDTPVLQSFTDVDHRLHQCLGISDLEPLRRTITGTCLGVLEEVAEHIRRHQFDLY